MAYQQLDVTHLHSGVQIVGKLVTRLAEPSVPFFVVGVLILRGPSDCCQGRRVPVTVGESAAATNMGTHIIDIGLGKPPPYSTPTLTAPPVRLQLLNKSIERNSPDTRVAEIQRDFG
jgi:hypothetical protein